MIYLLRRLDALPQSLRWAAFLPAGIVATLIVNGVLETAFDAGRWPTSPATTGGVIRGALLAFVWALALTVFPAVLSPRPWAVGVVMFAIGLLVRIAPVISALMTPYQRPRLPALAFFLTASIGAHALGGGVGLYLIRQMAARTNDVHMASRSERVRP